MKKRFYELDSLRGIAALMVVLYHYTQRYDEIYGHEIANIYHFGMGKYGIQLFFMISGFVIFMTINKTEKIQSFVISRFSRLYPAYWVAILLTYSATVMIPLPGRMVGLNDALVNLSMFQVWFRIPHVDGVYWTLSIELSFYIIMCFLYITGFIKRITTFSIVWIFFVLIAHYVQNYFDYKIHGALKIAFILDYGHLFVAGIMFYKLHIERKFRYFFCTLLAYATECLLNPSFSMLAGFYFILFYCMVFNLLSWLKFRPLVFLGAISYSFYLIHQNIGYIIIRALYENNISDPYLIILIPVTIIIILALMMNVFIEKPAMKVIRGYYRK